MDGAPRDTSSGRNGERVRKVTAQREREKDTDREREREREREIVKAVGTGELPEPKSPKQGHSSCYGVLMEWGYFSSID